MTEPKTTAVIFATLAGCCIIAAVVFSVAEVSFPTLVLSFLAIFCVATGFFFGWKQQKEEEKARSARASFVSPANLAVQEALAAYEAYRKGEADFLPREQLDEQKEQCIRAAREMVAALQDIQVSHKALALASLQECRERLREEKAESAISQEVDGALFRLLEDLRVLSAEKEAAN